MPACNCNHRRVPAWCRAGRGRRHRGTGRAPARGWAGPTPTHQEVLAGYDAILQQRRLLQQGGLDCRHRLQPGGQCDHQLGNETQAMPLAPPHGTGHASPAAARAEPAPGSSGPPCAHRLLQPAARRHRRKTVPGSPLHADPCCKREMPSARRDWREMWGVCSWEHPMAATRRRSARPLNSPPTPALPHPVTATLFHEASCKPSMHMATG